MKSLLFFLICLTQLGAAGQSLTHQQVAAIENSLKEEMASSFTPGLAICIIKDGRVCYSNSFGTANTATKQSLSDSTIFQIASVTKMFTSLALQMTLEKSNISLNEPIGSVLKGLSPGLASVTFAQLLNHTSGIIDAWPMKNTCPDDVLEYFATAGDKALFEKPGKVFSYSNNGYALAGLVIATLNRTSYTAAITNLILKPLQMSNSSFNLYDVAYKPLAAGHQVNNISGKASPTLLEFSKKSQAAGGMFSNIQDLSKFAIAILNKGLVDDNRIFSMKVMDTLFRKSNNSFSVPSDQLSYLSFPGGTYEYGNINFRYQQRDFIGLAGEAVFQNALLMMQPDERFAVIILSNRGFYLFTKSFKKIVDVVLNLKEPAVKADAVKGQNNAAFIGKYFVPDPEGRNATWSEIFQKENKLYMRLEDGREFELTQTGSAEFSFNDPTYLFPSAIAFYKDDKGDYRYLNYLFRTRIKK